MVCELASLFVDRSLYEQVETKVENLKTNPQKYALLQRLQRLKVELALYSMIQQLGFPQTLKDCSEGRSPCENFISKAEHSAMSPNPLCIQIFVQLNLC